VAVGREQTTTLLAEGARADLGLIIYKLGIEAAALNHVDLYTSVFTFNHTPYFTMKGLQAFTAASALAFFSGGLCASNSTNTTSSASSLAILADGNVDLGIAAEAYEKAVAFVSSLTNAQKISIITGQSLTDDNATWNALSSKDGASGINSKQIPDSNILLALCSLSGNGIIFR
jgi:hypothetical protein